MCGIVGQVGAIGSLESAEQVVRRQLALLRHRGPDDAAWIIDAQFAFGHVRLAIIDPAAWRPALRLRRRQPRRYLQRRDLQLRRAARRDARARRAFRTASDTEVLLQGYRLWGARVLDRLDGMFAFAIYDKTRRGSFARATRSGRSPSTISRSQSRFAFASECRAFALPARIRERARPRRRSPISSRSNACPSTAPSTAACTSCRPATRCAIADGKVEIDRYFESVPRDARRMPPRPSSRST